jgi:hypothetical protein
MGASQNNLSPSATPKTKVISVGTLPELLSLRQAVLEAAGFQVFTTTNEKHALLRIENGDCAVLLLCYSIEEGIREQLTKRFREKWPGRSRRGARKHGADTTSTRVGCVYLRRGRCRIPDRCSQRQEAHWMIKSRMHPSSQSHQLQPMRRLIRLRGSIHPVNFSFTLSSLVCLCQMSLLTCDKPRGSC